MVISLNFNAQVKNNYPSGGPKPGVYIPHMPSNNQPTQPQAESNASNGQNQWVIANGSWGNGNGYGNGMYGAVSFGYGNNFYPYSGPGYNYYGNNYSLKHTAKRNIREAGYLLNEAVAFNTWHDVYSPILAKAIRHYHYARQLYSWRNYNAALNHAERAKYLAWYSLQYFQNPGYYYDGFNGNVYNQPNPYSDPYNPYYKNNTNTNGGGNENGQKKIEAPKAESIDEGLPPSQINEKELIRTFDKSSVNDE